MNAQRAKKLRAKRPADNKRIADHPQPAGTLEDRDVKFRLNEDGAPIGLLLGLAALYFLPVLTAGNGKVLSAEGTDIWNQYFYWRHFGFKALAGGELPLWNQFIFSGTPYVAGIQSALFYPLNLIHLVFETAFAINLSIALHCFLASLFTYCLARYLGLAPSPSFLSALTYAYGAPFFFHIYAGHLSNLSTMAWLPLLFLSIEAFRRTDKIKFALLGGFVLSLEVFAGHPQYFFYSLIAVSLYFILSLLIVKEFTRLPKLMGGYVLFIAAGLTLAAVQLAPALELTANSMRESLTYEWVSVFSFPPENLITLLVPDFFGDFVSNPYWGKNYLWEMSVYLGVIPAVSAIAAVLFVRAHSVKVFSVIALVALLLAFGKHTPLLKILYHAAPGFNLFRGLSKFVFIFAFATSILAGYGFAWLAMQMESRNARIRSVVCVAVGGAAALLLVGLALQSLGQAIWHAMIGGLQFSQERYSPLPPLTGKVVSNAMASAFGSAVKTSLMLFGFAGCLFLNRCKAFSWKFARVPIIALAVIDLWHFGFRYLPTFDPSRLSMDSDLRLFFYSDEEPFRIATPIFSLSNVGMLDGIENVGGYDAIVVKQYNEFVNFAQGIPVEEPNFVMVIRQWAPLLRLLNVRYYVLDPTTRLDTSGLQRVFENARYNVYRDTHALPRSFIVHDVRTMKTREAIFQALSNPAFNPATTAFLDEALNDAPKDSKVQSPVPRIVARSLNTVVMDAQLSASGLLVLADAYYPGWKAYVDGRESNIYRVNHVMRGVLIPPGRHRVEFRYEPFSLKLGAAISLAAVLALAGWLFWSRVNAGRQRRESGGKL